MAEHGLTNQQIHDLIMLRAELREKYVPAQFLVDGGFNEASPYHQWIICEVLGMRRAAAEILNPETSDERVELYIPTWLMGEYQERKAKILNGGDGNS